MVVCSCRVCWWCEVVLGIRLSLGVSRLRIVFICVMICLLVCMNGGVNGCRLFILLFRNGCIIVFLCMCVMLV